MSSDHEPALDVFFSYSHHDEKLRDALETHLTLLKREGAIRTWHDRRIGAGREWQGEIDRHLESADLVLLLISPDFIASDYCFDREMTRALERHAAGEARVIPILLRPADWQTAAFARLQALPADGKPITAWPDRDSAFADVVCDIRRAIAEMRQDRRPAPPADGAESNRAGTPRRSRNRRTSAALLLVAVAAVVYLAVRPGGRTELSATEVQRIFEEREESTEIVGRLALRLLDGRQVGVGHVFHTGDYFRFEVTSSRDGWLYVFHRPPDGQLALLWPESGDSDVNAVAAHVPFTAPAGEEAFLFTEETGEEYFYVALAARPAKPTSAARSPGKRAERLERLLSGGLYGSAVPGRRRRVIVARPEEGPHVYFTPVGGADAAVELRLRHSE